MQEMDSSEVWSEEQQNAPRYAAAGDHRKPPNVYSLPQAPDIRSGIFLVAALALFAVGLLRDHRAVDAPRSVAKTSQNPSQISGETGRTLERPSASRVIERGDDTALMSGGGKLATSPASFTP